VYSLILRLVRWQRLPVIGAVARWLLLWHGTDIARPAVIGPGLRLLHAGIGVAIHGKTIIGSDVTIFHGVTIGRQDFNGGVFEGVVIEDEAVLCAGCGIFNRADCPPLVVGRGTVVGANAVLLQSTGEYEVWVGAPARRVNSVMEVPSLRQAQ
jgi:serine O-acetyltransferase